MLNTILQIYMWEEAIREEKCDVPHSWGKYWKVEKTKNRRMQDKKTFVGEKELCRWQQRI